MFFEDYPLHKDAKLRESLFWEYDIKAIDWDQLKTTVIQRVVERGRMNDFYAVLNMYGLNNVIETIKEIPYLNRKDIAFVCSVFNINEKELKCCTNEQSKNKHWNS